MKKKLIVTCSILLCSLLLHAQQPQSQDKKDSIAVQQGISKPAQKLSLKDSVLATFKFDKQSVLIDSLWRQELYNATLFPEMQKEILEQDFDTVNYDALPTELLKERLEQLDAKTPFDIAYNPSLESVIKNYLKNRKQSLKKLYTLSQYYFPMFEKELDRFNLPLEIKYLAIVESALNPRAKSRVGATGLWQFMFPTGKMYGLEVSSYVDERSDPLRSTVAACKYLEKLYSIFGDWDLALAAYNSGPGNVSKAIRRSGGYKNYWNIRPFLPRETAGYVPAFLATMYLFEYADEHGIEKQIPERPYFETDTVRIKQTLRFEQLAELLDLPIEEIQFLNPSYKLDIIPYIEEKNYTLRLPVEVIGTFVSNEDKIYAYAQAEAAKKEKPLPEFYSQNQRVVYRVKQGDFLGKIARQFGVPVAKIKQWNGLRSNSIRAGKTLVIYPKGEKRTISPVATQNQTQNEYVVKQGDSLWSIARKFPGVSAENIKNWNDISGTNLKPGMRLKLRKS